MSERRTHHNICQRGERCACYLTGFTDAEYDHGLALDTLEPAKSELASSTGYLRRWREVFCALQLAHELVLELCTLCNEPIHQQQKAEIESWLSELNDSKL
jgi:hypothetical protein